MIDILSAIPRGSCRRGVVYRGVYSMEVDQTPLQSEPSSFLMACKRGVGTYAASQKHRMQALGKRTTYA